MLKFPTWSESLSCSRNRYSLGPPSRRATVPEFSSRHSICSFSASSITCHHLHFKSSTRTLFRPSQQNPTTLKHTIAAYKLQIIVQLLWKPHFENNQNYYSNRYFLTERFSFPFPVPSEPQLVIILPSVRQLFKEQRHKTHKKGTIKHEIKHRQLSGVN